ncbi:hypothetical protein [Desulfoluna butyratoxydans]|uniref:Uncharacterized protein n=1 Tax=Desulfoluna butyratoxydans TaxID=231438 RepID=A0A4U8YL11_9BACT|nr:hypothetical protein [Desulfoluna butyratoxydans]VFQ44605.1 hypothetical protein MSL71_22540 [Desulfoluna butyratoxydans]
MLTLKRTTSAPTTTLPEGFHYVSQDNYCLVRLNDTDKKYLYSDSATSCIIVVMAGRNADDQEIVMLSHLSRKVRYDYFFNLVGAHFVGPVHIWGQGGNPPLAEASNDNTHTLMGWLMTHSLDNFRYNAPADKPSWWVEQVTLSLGQGDPNECHRDDFGVDLTTMKVSNQAFDLTSEQRDPTGGVQTLFAVFGMKIYPPVWLWKSTRPFDDALITRLVNAANQDNWTQILSMTDEEILHTYSSTPEWEVPWFVETLKESAQFVDNWNKTNGG